MRRFVCVLALVLVSVSVARAYDDDVDRLSVRAQVGVAMNTGVAQGYDYLNTAAAFSADFQYRVTKNISLVPASMSFFFYSGAESNGNNYYGSDNTSLVRGSGSENRLAWVEPGIYSPFYYPDYYYGGGYYGYRNYSPPTLAWAMSMTPGLKLQTSGRNLFNLYAQFGAGVYHHNQNASSYYGVGRLHKTSPAARAETGAEVIVSENVNLLIGGGYMWIGNNPAYNGMVNINMGVRLGF
jgi:hypothetical protein